MQSVDGVGDAHERMMAFLKSNWQTGSSGMTVANQGGASTLGPTKSPTHLGPDEQLYTETNTLVIKPEQMRRCKDSLPGFREVVQALTTLVLGHSSTVHDCVDALIERHPPGEDGGDHGDREDAHGRRPLAWTGRVLLEDVPPACPNGPMLVIANKPTEMVVKYPRNGGSVLLMRSSDTYRTLKSPPTLGTVYTISLFFAESVNAHPKGSPVRFDPPLARDCALKCLAVQRSGRTTRDLDAGNGLWATSDIRPGTCLGIYTGDQVEAWSVRPGEGTFAVASGPRGEGGEVLVIGRPEVDVLTMVCEPTRGQRIGGKARRTSYGPAQPPTHRN